MKSHELIDSLIKLIELLSTRSSDRKTLDELLLLCRDKGRWQKAYDLFNRIRLRNLEAERKNDLQMKSQLSFEESCAKTLYNMTKPSAPFDLDSPYWIIPKAFVAARHLQIDFDEVIKAITFGK